MITFMQQHVITREKSIVPRLNLLRACGVVFSPRPLTALPLFGSKGIIAENIRHEQRKIVKYNQLVANMVILYNVEKMTRVLKDLAHDGVEINKVLLGALPHTGTRISTVLGITT